MKVLDIHFNARSKNPFNLLRTTCECFLMAISMAYNKVAVSQSSRSLTLRQSLSFL